MMMQATTNHILTGTEEHQLLQRLAAGEINAFWQIFQQHRDYLFRCCLKWMNGNSTEAEDLLSQATVKAWEKVREGAVAIKNFKAWLTQLTHNLCMDLHRQRNRGAFGVENLEAIATADKQEWVSQEETPVLAATRRELEFFLQNTINNLSLRLRENFILHWYKEQSYQEIAQQLNISYDNVRKRISQARAILRQRLSEYEGEETCAASPSRKQRQPIKTNILASSGDQEQVLTVASNSPKNRTLSVETTQHYQSSHYELPLQAGNEKSETQPEILPPAKFAPIESVLGEAESDGKLEEIEIVRGEIEAALLVGQPAPGASRFCMKTIKNLSPLPPSPKRGGGKFLSFSPFPKREGGWGVRSFCKNWMLPPALTLYQFNLTVKQNPLVWEMLELFELRWRRVWMDSGGC